MTKEISNRYPQRLMTLVFEISLWALEFRAAMRATIGLKGEAKPLMKIVLELVGGSDSDRVPEVVRSESVDCVTEFWKYVPGDLPEEEAR